MLSKVLRSSRLFGSYADALKKIPRVDEKLIWQIARNHEVLISIEEGSIGGFGSHLSKFLSDKSLLEKIKFRSMILPDRFIEHNDPKKMYEEAGLDSRAIENKIYEIIDSKIIAQKQI